MIFFRVEKGNFVIMGLALIADAATEAANTIDFSAFISALTGSISVAQVLTVLAAVVGVGMTFFLMWLGVKKATRSFTTAVSTGRIRI